ncbi:unnamed protein product [Sphagnum troendelagicum]
MADHTVAMDCTRRRSPPATAKKMQQQQSLSFLVVACVMTLLHVFGVSPALSTTTQLDQQQQQQQQQLHQQQNPRALFVVNAPGQRATAPLGPAKAPAPTPVLTLHQKVVGALRSAGTFGAISGALDSLTDNDPIKPSITLFAPEDSAFQGVPLNSSAAVTTLLNYHTAAGILTFQQLLTLAQGHRIQTVTTGISIVVVNNQTANYQLDNAHIVRANLYNDGSVVVHGVDAIFDTRFYNTATLGPVPAPAPVAPAAPPPVAAAASSTPGATSAVPSSTTSTTPSKTDTNAATASYHRLLTTTGSFSSSLTAILVGSVLALMLLLSSSPAL